VSDATTGSSGTDQCLIDVLAQLRQSGRDSVIAEGNVTEIQELMHVPDAIEDWVAERIATWRQAGRPVPLLIVLSGNAGDGKSDLVERLRMRPEVAADDLEVIADATHSESPSQSQAERLAAAFSRFPSEDPGGGENPCVLVAMNVGMVIAFFAALRGTPDESRFAALQAVLERSLGLTRGSRLPPDHWECDVVNLDHRNVLGLQHNGLFAGMLAKLNPEEPGSLTYNAAAACADCSARGSCWVRTNLSLLRLPEVQEAIHELLWEATLGSDVHLSPRNLWDFLYQATTGGLEIPAEDGPGQFLSCDWIQEELPASANHLSAGQLSLVHRRLLYNSLFETPQPDGPSRGPLLDALAAADPIRRGGKHTHLLEGEVRAAPKADAEALSTLALMATEPVPGAPGQTRQDPLLDGLASLATDPEIWHEDGRRNANELALGVSRRARVTGVPAEVQAEVSDPDSRAFLELLHEYAAWMPGRTAPAAINDFWLEMLVGGVAQIFGIEVQGKTYFRLDTLSPTTRFPAYVPVDLKRKLSIVADRVTSSQAAWLSSVAYLPRTVTATIDAGGDEPWAIPVDLQLYRLLSHVSRGYAASSVDLEAFFRLRYACERLGSTDESGEIVFRALDTGEVLRLQREQQLSGWETEFTRVSG
jgi:hypothetical protein